MCRHRQKSLYLHPNFELKLADKRRSIVSHTQDKHLRQPKAVVCRGQHKRLSARHLPHGTRQFQVVVGLFQDPVLTQPSEAEENRKLETKKNTWKLIIQLIVSIATAIATTLGVTSCMGANVYF